MPLSSGIGNVLTFISYWRSQSLAAWCRNICVWDLGCIVRSVWRFMAKLQQSWGRILGRNWDKSLESFPPFYSQSSTNGFYPFPPPPSEKVVWNWFVQCKVNIVYGMATSGLRTLRIMPRNSNKISRTWIRLLGSILASSILQKNLTNMAVKTLLNHF
jgi:hypothetical protein